MHKDVTSVAGGDEEDLDMLDKGKANYMKKAKCTAAIEEPKDITSDDFEKADQADKEKVVVEEACRHVLVADAIKEPKETTQTDGVKHSAMAGELEDVPPLVSVTTKDEKPNQVCAANDAALLKDLTDTMSLENSMNKPEEAH